MADKAAAAALAPFEAGVREAWAYRSFLADRLAAEKRYALDMQRVLDAHRPPDKDKDADAAAGRRAGRGKKGSAAAAVAHTGHAGRAWNAMVRAEGHEAAARLKRVNIVEQGALARLDTWLRAQDRALENLRVNLSASVRVYLDARNKTVPAAQQAYKKRSRELEDLDSQEQAVKLRDELLADRASRHSHTRHTHTSVSTSGSAASVAKLPPPAAGPGDTSPLNTSSSYEEVYDAPHASEKGTDRFADKDWRDKDDDAAGAGAGEGGVPTPSLSGDPAPRPFPRLFESLAIRSKDKDKEGSAGAGAGKGRTNLFSRRARAVGSGSGSVPEASGAGHGSGVPGDGAPVGGYTPDAAGFEVLLRKKARVQREAEELDAVYRREVIRLETLRLSVVHFLKMAQEQCLEHRGEMGVQLVTAWAADETQSRLLDDAVTAYRAQAQQEAWLHRNSIQKDVAMIQSQFPSLGVTQVPYHHYTFGDAKDLLFGVKLMDYASSHNAPSRPPVLVQKCVEFLDAHALDTEGLYRISGKRTAIETLARRAEADERAFTLMPGTDDPSVVAGLLKRYLRELPDALLPLSRETTSTYLASREEERAMGWPSIRRKIRSQPLVHQVTLRLILEHLARVDAHSKQNKMPASNLALVLGPVIFGGAKDRSEYAVLPGPGQDKTMEDLILYGKEIFEHLKGTAPSPFPGAGSGSGLGAETPPLPPPPLQERDPEAGGHIHTQSLELGRAAPWRAAAASATSLVRRGSEALTGGLPRRALTTRNKPHPSPLAPAALERDRDAHSLASSAVPSALCPATGVALSPGAGAGVAVGAGVVERPCAASHGAYVSDLSPTDTSAGHASISAHGGLLSAGSGLGGAAEPPLPLPVPPPSLLIAPTQSPSPWTYQSASPSPSGDPSSSQAVVGAPPLSSGEDRRGLEAGGGDALLAGVPHATALAPGIVHRPMPTRPLPLPGLPSAASAPHAAIHPAPLAVSSHPPRLPPLHHAADESLVSHLPAPGSRPLSRSSSSSSSSPTSLSGAHPAYAAYGGTYTAASDALRPPSPVSGPSGLDPSPSH